MQRRAPLCPFVDLTPCARGQGQGAVFGDLGDLFPQPGFRQVAQQRRRAALAEQHSHPFGIWPKLADLPSFLVAMTSGASPGTPRLAITGLLDTGLDACACIVGWAGMVGMASTP